MNTIVIPIFDQDVGYHFDDKFNSIFLNKMKHLTSECRATKTTPYLCKPYCRFGNQCLQMRQRNKTPNIFSHLFTKNLALKTLDNITRYLYAHQLNEFVIVYQYKMRALESYKHSVHYIRELRKYKIKMDVMTQERREVRRTHPNPTPTSTRDKYWRLFCIL